MRKGAILLVVLFVVFANVYLAFAQPVSLECLVRKYDGPGGRKAGDIVTVKRSPASWGKGEGLPNYVIIKVTGIGLGDFEQYKGRHVLVNESEPQGERARSKYRFNLSTLPGYLETSQTVELNLFQTVSNLIDRREEILSERTR
jgi:hypothetical protein